MAKKTLFEKISQANSKTEPASSVARVIEHILRTRRLLDGDQNALPSLPDITECLASDSEALQRYVDLLRALILRHEPRIESVAVKSLKLEHQQRICELEFTLFDEVIQRQFSF